MKASRLLVAAALAAVSIADVVLLAAYLDAAADSKKAKAGQSAAEAKLRTVEANLRAAEHKAKLHTCVSADFQRAPSSFTRLVNPPPMVDPALRGEVSGG